MQDSCRISASDYGEERFFALSDDNFRIFFVPLRGNKANYTLLIPEVSEVKVEVKMEVNSLRSWKL